MRLTLRTLLAYLDDTLDPRDSKTIGRKITESEDVPELVERIRKITRRRGLASPSLNDPNAADPNTIAEYLDNELNAADVQRLEEAALASDSQLAELAACHQILSLVLSEPARVPPTANARMYLLVSGAASIPNRVPSTKPVVASLDAKTEAQSGAVPVSDAAGDDATSTNGVRLLIAAAVLLVVLSSVLALALPRPNSTLGPDPLRAALAKVGSASEPTVVAMNTPKPEPKIEPKPEPKAEPMPMPMPVEPTPTPMPMPMVPVEPMPMPMPKPKPLVPPVEKPNVARVEIGTARNPDSVLFVRPGESKVGDWAKAPKAVPTIFSNDILMSLPGFSNEVLLRNGVKVTLFGNVPGWVELPIFDSTVQFHVPPQGFDADFTLRSGRVFLSSTTPMKSQKVRVRVLDVAWDITLADEKTEIVLDRVQVFALGAKFAPAGGGESPQTELSIGIAAGEAGIKIGTRDNPKLLAPTILVWDNKGLGVTEPRKLDQPSPLWAKTPPASPWTTAVQTTMTGLAKKYAMSNDNPSLPLTEMVFGERTTESQRICGLLGLQATGEISQVASALRSDQYPDMRFYGVLAIRHWAAGEASRERELYQLLVEKRGYNADQARDFVSLLHDFTESEASNPATYARIFELMASDQIALRELAFFHLRNLDPDAIREQQFQFDAGAPDDYRSKILANWQRRIPDGKLPPGIRPAAPAPMK